MLIVPSIWDIFETPPIHSQITVSIASNILGVFASPFPLGAAISFFLYSVKLGAFVNVHDFIDASG